MVRIAGHGMAGAADPAGRAALPREPARQRRQRQTANPQVSDPHTLQTAEGATSQVTKVTDRLGCRFTTGGQLLLPG